MLQSFAPIVAPDLPGFGQSQMPPRDRFFVYLRQHRESDYPVHGRPQFFGKPRMGIGSHQQAWVTMVMPAPSRRTVPSASAIAVCGPVITRTVVDCRSEVNGEKKHSVVDVSDTVPLGVDLYFVDRLGRKKESMSSAEADLGCSRDRHLCWMKDVHSLPELIWPCRPVLGKHRGRRNPDAHRR